ncbi:MAG: M3 family peptidase, partial [Bacteroidales bacterium]|nr:M3 family peptidase [Bacteroidales bacterium]
EVYQPDVTVYEVMDGDRLMGILYLDLYPNAGKSGGAWKTDFRSQSNLPHFVEKGTDRPLIQIVCNFTKPVGDAPALLSFDELETFMHEFGHAIHNLLSDVTYPSLSGTAVQRDFVELPSQIMENWCYEQEFLNTFARHYQTGETIPAEYIAKIKAAKNFQSGWYCIRQLNFGLTDLAFHTLDSTFTGSVDEFEAQHTINYMPVVPGTCFSTAFGHIFSGGYASGYYGYKWAEVLDADCFSRFQENGIFDRATAQSFRDNILSKGGTLPAAEMFRNFMGRDPNPNALAYRSGFLFQRDAGAIEK